MIRIRLFGPGINSEWVSGGTVVEIAYKGHQKVNALEENSVV